MYIDKKSDVQSRSIGKNTTIWQYVVILENAVIGENCNINCHCFIENNVAIGNNVTIKSGVYLWDGITIKDNVFIGPNTTFINDLYPRSKQYPERFLKTVIKDGASIGANCTIIGGITIEEFAVIGAGSVVTCDIPQHTLYFGNPARFRGYVCTCGRRLDSKFKCKFCGKLFKMEDSYIIESK